MKIYQPVVDLLGKWKMTDLQVKEIIHKIQQVRCYLQLVMME